MEIEDAATALESVGRTQSQLAEYAHWPTYRHAMFGVAEALLVAAPTQQVQLSGAMVAAGATLLVYCVWDDRRRKGMFVSGWQQGKTRPLVIALILFLAAMFGAGFFVRGFDGAGALGLVIALVTFAVCTAASLAWEKLYRAELMREGQQ